MYKIVFSADTFTAIVTPLVYRQTGEVERKRQPSDNQILGGFLMCKMGLKIKI
jgi:hypothetical protein